MIEKLIMIDSLFLNDNTMLAMKKNKFLILIIIVTIIFLQLYNIFILKKSDYNKDFLQKNKQYIENENIPITTNIEKISIDTLEYNFSSVSEIEFKDLTIDEENIIKGIKEPIYSIGMIRYGLYNELDGYIKKTLLIQNDRTDIEYIFFIKLNVLYAVRKVRSDFNPPKWDDYSKLDSKKYTDCYLSLNNCSEEVLFLYDYINS
ncbi:MAG: hypothetical protein PHI37_03400 [Candidatus Gracilibacteria bacterium]|nr:hypothetical protein [Candidatus Gracilibacteria bacterium]